MKGLHSLAWLCFFACPGILPAQDCESQLGITLKNNQGGFYSNHKVILTAKAGGAVYTLNSNASGEVLFTLPCEMVFEVVIDNYSRKLEYTSPPGGAVSKKMLSYAPDMIQSEKDFAMNATEMAAVDKTASGLPDTFNLATVQAKARLAPDHFKSLALTLKDLENGPLANELVIFTGTKRNKSFKGTTNAAGELMVYLPKGDTYTLNFVHNKNYARQECLYTKGTASGKAIYTYLGTKEIERRKKEEAERIAAEEKRLKEEAEAFKAWCKKLKITEEEGYKRKLREANAGPQDDTVISAVFNRNKWSEKLIVCDLTGSMLPYSTQLTIWYQLNYKKEKNLQFVFFNDGDKTPDHKKVIGQTGGIYYSPAKGLDSLQAFIAMVSSRGYGGDCPENNMEALIKGVTMAKPYKELVMIVDNYAPVKDIGLLSTFNKPVHIILCGNRSTVLEDYLNIAWKTKGSIHTIEEDITDLAKKSEGQEVSIGGQSYRIMGGSFVKTKRG